ncbi:hypothetical protein FM120_20775 [Sphingobacterium faecium PCAi_F2.5]|nr:hypothetical protein FM120_20775 [Sphingobacterium faecium PCAi_F2.5]
MMKRKESTNPILPLPIQDRAGQSAINALIKNKLRQPE